MTDTATPIPDPDDLPSHTSLPSPRVRPLRPADLFGRPGREAGEKREISELTLDPLDRPAFHGLAGDVVREILPYSEADPFGLLTVLLTMFGNAVGHGPFVWLGDDQHPARLFVVLLGDSATGKKGTAVSAVLRLMRRVDSEWTRTRILNSGLTSSQAMIARVDDAQSNDHRLLVYESDLDRLFATMAQRGDLSAKLRQAYDGGILETVTKYKQDSLHSTNPNISILGGSQPGVLFESMPDAEIKNGGANRYLYIAVKQSKLGPPTNPVPEPTLDSLTARLREALDFAQTLARHGVDPISLYLYDELGMQPRTAVGLVLQP